MNVSIQIQESTTFARYNHSQDEMISYFMPKHENCILPLSQLKSWTVNDGMDPLISEKTKVNTLVIRGKVVGATPAKLLDIVETLANGFPKVIGELNRIGPSCSTMSVIPFRATFFHEPFLLCADLTYVDSKFIFDSVGRIVGARYNYLYRDYPDAQWEKDLIKRHLSGLPRELQDAYAWQRESWMLRLLDTFGRKKKVCGRQIFSGMEIYAKDVK